MSNAKSFCKRKPFIFKIDNKTVINFKLFAFVISKKKKVKRDRKKLVFEKTWSIEHHAWVTDYKLFKTYSLWQNGKLNRKIKLR